VSLVVYGNPHSSNALKVRFALAEMTLEHETIEVSLAWPRPDWYAAIQPTGRVPVLADGDLLVGESNTILRYLAGREGRDDLYPADPRSRSQVDWAMDVWSATVRPALGRLEGGVLFSGDGADPDRVAAAMPAVDEALDVWEQFVRGDGTTLECFSIADMCVAPVLWRSLRLPIDLAGRPRTAALRLALSEHPAFVAAGPVS
jgi:glutathione S-transferase